MNDPINDEKWDSTWSKFFGALKTLEKDRLTKIDGYVLKGLLTKKFKEDEDQSSINSEGFTDVEKQRREKD